MVGNVLLVVPLMVLQELDRKKQDPALRKACSVAVQLLRGMPEQRCRYEESDLARLPPDFADTPDNRILSVAMKYHHPNLRLVTNDEILGKAAESMNVIAVKVERFNDAVVTRATTPAQAHKKQPHKKGAHV
jgi:rRNA-processing protein FCF1